MFGHAFLVLIAIEDPIRTPAIYRFPASEQIEDRISKLIDEYGYDSLCVDPKPSSKTIELAKGRVKFFDAKLIDTTPNLNWRNAAINFANGKISPAKFLSLTNGLKSTVHFLSSPKTPDLRTATPSQTTDETYSLRSVFAEFVLLGLPGRVCVTSGDAWHTRELPESGRLQSWVLAVRDRLGPSLYMRAESPFLATGKLSVIRADARPGLLIWKMSSGKKGYIFTVNNSNQSVEIPGYVSAKVIGLSVGLDLNGPKPRLQGPGFYVQEN